ncbi:MAG: hypothetical protein IKW03_06435 [Clostridia bacterium]|nr:hypothetical protein [Clostridia bacterium]
MYSADCFVSMSGNRDSLIKAIEVLKKKLTQLEKTANNNLRGTQRLFNTCAEIGDTPGMLDKIIVMLQEEPQRDKHDTDFSFQYPLDNYCLLSDEIGYENVFFDVAAILNDDELNVDIEWEGPGDNHNVEIKVSKKVMKVSCYDWDADWDVDCDDEDDAGETEETIYHFLNNTWVCADASK